jgi:CRP-like cAMP-binding protein
MKENPVPARPVVFKYDLPSTVLERHRNDIFYSQGEPADAVFYIENGHVKLTVLSGDGKEAVLGILGPGSFFGESCVADQPERDSSAIALTECIARKIIKAEMSWALKKRPDFSDFFVSYIIGRKIRLEEDLADQLCNPCEVRLARTLLSLVEFRHSADRAPVIPRIDQHTLAAMVGTTQPRISFLLHKFKERGLIECVERLQVNRSLLEIVPVRTRELFQKPGPNYPILNIGLNHSSTTI